MALNRQIHLISRPSGIPKEQDFAIIQSMVQDPGPDEILARTLYLSVDPYLRGRMRDSELSFSLNSVISSGGIAVVEKSNDKRFRKGDLITGIFDWADYTIVKGDYFQKVNSYGTPLTTVLGVLGLTGVTAYFGLLEVGKPREGEMVVISSAAGAVGSIAGQIAKLKGCYVVGITGSEKKADFLVKELQFNGAINYKEGRIGSELKNKCPRGIDVYFDNVGGPITDEVLPYIAYGSRIIICGQIASYNLETPDAGIRPFPYLLANSALAQGFMVRNYSSQFERAKAEIAKWINDGVLKYHETVTEGLENTPRAFIGLFRGENSGKQIVKCE